MHCILMKKIVSSMVEWLRCCTYDQHGISSKPTCAILLCPWENTSQHFSLQWSWQAVLSYSHISIKLQMDSNILASLKAG